MSIHRIYAPFQRHFRARRMRQFAAMFGPTSSTRIADIGGSELNWGLIDAAPQVTLVNVAAVDGQDGRFTTVRGDGRALAFADHSFDIAYSNSVIEHVGDTGDQESFAREIRRVAPRYYVQTPNRWFPVEPHLIAVGLHWLPRRVARRLVRWCSVWGLVTRPTQAQVDAMLAGIRLLDRRRMLELFPDAELLEERALWLVKSWIAVRR